MLSPLLRLVFVFFLLPLAILAQNTTNTASNATVACGFKITAYPSDTVASLSKTWRITTDQFTALNPGVTNATALVPGGKYCVMPVDTSTPSNTTASGNATATTSFNFPGGTGQCIVFTVTSTITTVTTTIGGCNTTSSSFMWTGPTSTPNSSAAALTTAKVASVSSSASTSAVSSPSSTTLFPSTAASTSSTIPVVSSSPASTTPSTSKPVSTSSVSSVIGVVSSSASSSSSSSAPASTKASSTTSTTSKSSTTSTAPTFTPTQSGLVSSCTDFYYVATGDTCNSIISAFSLSSSNFYTWNPSIGNTCASLWAKYWVCVGTSAPGGQQRTAVAASQAASTSTVTKTTSSSVPPPSPLMSGTSTTCRSYYAVQSGMGCWDIENKFGISDAQFRAWNTGVNSACDNLWKDYYVCVGV